jgi:hypothetical protein
MTAEPPLARRARTAALGWSIGVALVATLAGAIRILPWVVDPAVPARVAVPFARTLLEAALEIALLVGWPVGWALAAQGFVETGEARVLALLGERPARTVARLAPHGLALAMLLGATAWVGGRDASAPGRVAEELVAEARVACTANPEANVQAVPFVGVAWLCGPAGPPRLYGHGPGGVPVSASSARLSGDLRRIELDDARMLLPGVRVHVGTLAIEGLTPWGRASTLGPVGHALLVGLSGALCAALAALLVLRQRAHTRLGALVLGAAGPLATLGAVRVLDRADARSLAYLLAPLAGACVTAVAALLVSRLLARRGSGRV